jgi:hypothetical protein
VKALYISFLLRPSSTISVKGICLMLNFTVGSNLKLREPLPDACFVSLISWFVVMKFG